MPIYHVKIAGRTKRVLVKADSAAKAKDTVVQATALSAEEMADALANGEQVWNPSAPFPADELTTDPASALPPGKDGTEGAPGTVQLDTVAGTVKV
jgi:hypothetical protein